MRGALARVEPVRETDGAGAFAHETHRSPVPAHGFVGFVHGRGADGGPAGAGGRVAAPVVGSASVSRSEGAGRGAARALGWGTGGEGFQGAGRLVGGRVEAVRPAAGFRTVFFPTAIAFLAGLEQNWMVVIVAITNLWGYLRWLSVPRLPYCHKFPSSVR